jgi:hypothetical protein
MRKKYVSGGTSPMFCIYTCVARKGNMNPEKTYRRLEEKEPYLHACLVIVAKVNAKARSAV